jgi:hypothetical protein
MFNSIQESLEKGYVLVAEDSLVQAKKLKRFFLKIRTLAVPHVKTERKPMRLPLKKSRN